MEIIEEEEYLDDIDFDDIRRLRRNDVNYFEHIVDKIENFDPNVNLPKSQHKENQWISNVATFKEEGKKPMQILLKKQGKPNPILSKNRPNYRKNMPRTRINNNLSTYKRKQAKIQVIYHTSFMDINNQVG